MVENNQENFYGLAEAVLRILFAQVLCFIRVSQTQEVHIERTGYLIPSHVFDCIVKVELELCFVLYSEVLHEVHLEWINLVPIFIASDFVGIALQVRSDACLRLESL